MNCVSNLPLRTANWKLQIIYLAERKLNIQAACQKMYIPNRFHIGWKKIANSGEFYHWYERRSKYDWIVFVPECGRRHQYSSDWSVDGRTVDHSRTLYCQWRKLDHWPRHHNRWDLYWPLVHRSNVRRHRCPLVTLPAIVATVLSLFYCHTKAKRFSLNDSTRLIIVP